MIVYYSWCVCVKFMPSYIFLLALAFVLFEVRLNTHYHFVIK